MKIAEVVLAVLLLVPNSSISGFVHKYLVGRHGPIPNGTRIAAKTLANGTVLAYVFGESWCGEDGGCVLLILKPIGSSYRVIGERLAVKLPVYVLDSKTHGEPQLGLIRGGTGQDYRGGLWYPETIVSFNGRSYGGISSLDPALKPGELRGRQAIFRDKSDGFALGAPL